MKAVSGSRASVDRRTVLTGLGAGAVAVGIGGCKAHGPKPDVIRQWGGNPQAVFEAGHRVRDGAIMGIDFAAPADHVVDVVIVGAGLSGLAAALTLKQQSADQHKILLIDNHNAPGGAAKADRLQVDGQQLIAPQGSIVFQKPTPGLAPSAQAMTLLESVVPALTDYAVPHMDRGYSLVLPAASAGNPVQFHRSLFDAPIPEAVQAGYFTFLQEAAKLYERPDWEAFLSALDPILFRDYVVQRGWNSAVFQWMIAELATFFGIPDQVSAAAVYRQYGGGPPQIYSTPSGNAAFIDGFVSRIWPQWQSSSGYETLQPEGQRIGLQLNATVAAVSPSSDKVRISYFSEEKIHHVDSKAVIMAGGAFMTRHIIRGQSVEKQQALQRFIHAPIVWVNVGLRQARAVDAADPLFMTIMSGSRHSLLINYEKRSLSGWADGRDPDRPIVLGLSLPFYQIGLPAREQAAIGRQEILSLALDDYESWVRDDLQKVFGPFGFDAERDIAALSVCRWGHGYAYPDPGFLTDGARNVAAAPEGRVFYANTDLDGFSHLSGAIGHGHRAATQVLAFL